MIARSDIATGAKWGPGARTKTPSSSASACAYVMRSNAGNLVSYGPTDSSKKDDFHKEKKGLCAC